MRRLGVGTRARIIERRRGQSQSRAWWLKEAEGRGKAEKMGKQAREAHISERTSLGSSDRRKMVPRTEIAHTMTYNYRAPIDGVERALWLAPDRHRAGERVRRESLGEKWKCLITIGNWFENLIFIDRRASRDFSGEATADGSGKRRPERGWKLRWLTST